MNPPIQVGAGPMLPLYVTCWMDRAVASLYSVLSVPSNYGHQHHIQYNEACPKQIGSAIYAIYAEDDIETLVPHTGF